MQTQDQQQPSKFDRLINREFPRDVWALWVQATLALSIEVKS